MTPSDEVAVIHVKAAMDQTLVRWYATDVGVMNEESIVGLSRRTERHILSLSICVIH